MSIYYISFYNAESDNHGSFLSKQVLLWSFLSSLDNLFQICLGNGLVGSLNLRGMYLEDESHSYHISSLMDRKMKGEKLDGNLEKGFDMLRKDNQPQRARSSSLSSKG